MIRDAFLDSDPSFLWILIGLSLVLGRVWHHGLIHYEPVISGLLPPLCSPLKINEKWHSMEFSYCICVEKNSSQCVIYVKVIYFCDFFCWFVDYHNFFIKMK
jgi:hypothetical protein